MQEAVWENIMGDHRYAIEDLICVCIARQVEDGEILAQGLATPLVAAGYLLAWHTHAPHAYFASAIGQSLCNEAAPLRLSDIESLWLGKSMCSFGFVQASTDLLPRYPPKEFFRPGQVDRNGNFNNIAFGNDYRKPRLRLPGTGGIPDVTPISDHIYLYVPRHSRVTFVENIDFRSGLGHHECRKSGEGPKYLVSDLGQFDFYKGRMRLTHMHPGVDLKRIIAKSGFELLIADPLEVTQLPNEDEIHLLNKVIDPLGIRYLEFLSGHKRRRTIREIIENEKVLES
jgi:acyl CoA:acetate/3-ketoacid CoA transferase beta subunit